MSTSSSEFSGNIHILLRAEFSVSTFLFFFIFQHLLALNRSCKIFNGTWKVLEKSWIFVCKRMGTLYNTATSILTYLFLTDIPAMRLAHNFTRTRVFAELGTRPTGRHHPQCTAAELYSDDYFECFVRQNTMTGYHLTGTCRMGAAADNTAVVDPQLRLTPLTFYCYFNPLTPTVVIWLHI